MSDDTIPFEVTAGDDATELFVVDGRFKLVDRAIGHRVFALAPGVYKIKDRSGLATTERLLAVRAGTPPLQLPPILLDSAIPFTRSTLTSPGDIDVATRGIDATPLVLGSGSRIAVFIHRWTPPNAPPSSDNPARGLRLLGVDGRIVADLEMLGANAMSATWVTIDVDPGAYRLASQDREGARIEQTLIASKGWQTDVWLVRRADERDAAGRVDVINAAISLRRPGTTFDPDDAALRREEILRLAVHHGQSVLSDAIRAHIVDPDALPMLALHGAHLLMRDAAKAAAARPDAPIDGALRDVLVPLVERLRSQLGKHPDVEAIASHLEREDPAYVFDMPPMIRASWPLLLKASVARPACVPSDSLSAHVAERVWGEGTWLHWVGEESAAPDRTVLWQTQAIEVLGTLLSEERAARRASDPGAARPPVGLASILGTIAPIVLKALAPLMNRSGSPFPETGATVRDTRPPAAPPDIDPVITPAQREALVDRLGIPLSSIDAWLDGPGR